MFFNILATFAEFEVDLLRMRTREGMAVAKAKGKLKGKQPKLSVSQQSHLLQQHRSGEHTIADLAELFSVSRATVYRVLERQKTTGAESCESRTGELRPSARSGARPSTRSTRSAAARGCGVIPTGITGHGLG